MWQFPGLCSTSWRVNDDFHFPEDPETQQLLPGLVRPLHHLHRKTELTWMPAKVNDHCISTTWTYINQVLCPKHFRDFMSQKVLLGSANPVNVHSLNYNLSVESDSRTSNTSQTKHSRFILWPSITLVSHPCFQELLVLFHAQSLETRCRQPGPRALDPASVEGPGSGTQKQTSKS